MIQTIWIKSFRCLTELVIDFSDHLFISIISENNVGKTSILEACYVLSHLKSFVTSDIRQVISYGSEATLLGIKLEQHHRNKNYYLKIDQQGRKSVSVDQHIVRKKSDIDSLFRSVYISSDCLHLITFPPKFRRDALDLLISQVSASYRNNLANYRQLLKQKNKALKYGANDSVIVKFNEQMVTFMIEIMKERYPPLI